MSKYDKDREKLGIQTLGDSPSNESPSSSSTSKYAKDREALFNPQPAAPPTYGETGNRFGIPAIPDLSQSDIVQLAKENALLKEPQIVSKDSFKTVTNQPADRDYMSSKTFTRVPGAATAEDTIKQIKNYEEYTGTPVSPADRLGQTLSDAVIGATDAAALGIPNAIARRAGVPLPEESTAGKVGEIVGMFAPGTLAYKGASAALRPLLTNAPKLAQTFARGAAAGAAYQGAVEGADVALDTRNDGDNTFGQRAANVGIAAGVGGAGDATLSGLGSLIAKYPGSKLSQAVSRYIGRQAERVEQPQQQGPILALPEGRPRGNINTAETPDVIYAQETTPRGLPEPNVAPPTRARIEQRPNVAEQRLNDLFDAARSAGVATKEEVEAIWRQQGGTGSLDDLIDAAYPKNRVQPGLVSKARETQRLRETYGVGMPVKTMAERYPQGGVQASAAAPETVIARGPASRLVNATRSSKEQAAASAEIVSPGAASTSKYAAERAAQQAKPISKYAAEREAQQVTSTMKPKIGERANYRNVQANGKISDSLKRAINETDRTYNVKTNAESVAGADDAMRNVSAAEVRFLNNETGGAEHIATGYKLMQRFDALGDHERALVIANKLAADLTNSGQTTQAASIISRLSPEGQLLNLTRTAQRNGKEVTTADSVKFKKLAAQVQENSGAGLRANQFNEILSRIERGGKIGSDDLKKLSDFLASAEKKAKPESVKDDIPKELNEPRKREKIISFLDDAEQAALARIAARRNQLNSLPLGEWGDHAIVVAAQLAKGTIRAATHVEDLVKMFGEEIRPVATQVFKKAQSLIKNISPTVGEGDIAKANQAFRRLSGQAAAEKAAVQQMAGHVKKLIFDAKKGKIGAEDLQKLRDYADEIAEMTQEKPSRTPTQEERFLQTVKSLAKKIAQVENEKTPTDQANREVSSLLRQIAKLGTEDGSAIEKQPLDSRAISDLAHDVMEKTRPNPKPTTPQEKLVEKYIREREKSGENVSQHDIDTLRQLAKDVTRLSGDSKVEADIAMQKILNSYEKSSLWDKSQALRYIGMLLNTGTQAVNAASGPIMATTGYAADIFGTMLDITISSIKNQPRTTTLYGSNPLKFIARYMKGLKTGVKAGALGVNPAGIQSTNEIRGLAYKSLYNPAGLLERGLGAVSKGPDYATYNAVYKSELEKQGFLDAINSGIKRSDKKAIRSHIENFMNEPTEEAMLQADRIAKNTTFQRSDTTGGKIANYLNSSPALIKPGVNAIFPFVRTPINMASTAVTMTPAGIIKGLYQLTSKSKASQREAIRTMSLGLTGTGISALGYYLSQLGIITGANDSGDKDVDAIREQAGRGKYRFNTSALKRYLSAMLNGEGDEEAEKAAKYREGDSTFDYNKLQPLAFPLAAGASIANNSDKPLVNQVKNAAVDSYGSLYGMSTLKGVQDVFQPTYGGTIGEKALGAPSRIAESFFKSFSPSALAQEARRQDPIVRKTPYNNGIIQDVAGYFKSRTPGLSDSLPANKTTLGADKKNAPGFLGSYANPYRSEVAAYSSAAALISDLIDRTGDNSLAPSAPSKSVSGKNKKGESLTVSIPQDRYEQLQEEVGQGIIAKISAIPADWNDVKKADKIKSIYEDVRSKEMNKVKREYGIIVR